MATSTADSSSEKHGALYEPRGVYRGPGSVFAENLNGTIEGSFEVQWDELGACRISCTPSNLHPFAAIVISQDFDQFRDLQVKSSEGVFYAGRCFLDKASLSMDQSGGSSELVFVTLGGLFSPVSSKSAAFWDAPILNFVMDLRPALIGDIHPLQVSRLFQNTADASAQNDVSSLNESRRRVISFVFSGGAAFVEHVPNYEDVKRKLKGREEPVLVTSLMAGPIPKAADLSLEGVKGWFPQDAILALTLATSSRVSLGFIELRDIEGALSHRLHLSFINGPYSDGSTTISDHIHSDYGTSGTGPLISGYLSVPESKLEMVRMLTETIETAQSALQTPDHAFAFIVRGLDGLANSLQLTRRILSDELPKPEAKEVKAVLLNARQSLHKLSKRVRKASDITTANVIDRIASRAEQADAIEDSFGLSISRVLEHFRLRDQEAINSFYSKYPRADGLTWNQALNMYRGGVIHKGFLDYSTGVLMDDVVCCTRHLIDVAIRICLREVNYQGTYNPFNRTAMQRNGVDWVVDETSIAQFGFNGHTPKLIKTVGF